MAGPGCAQLVTHGSDKVVPAAVQRAWSVDRSQLRSSAACLGRKRLLPNDVLATAMNRRAARPHR